MSTIFNYCDSMPRYIVNNKDTDAVIDTIQSETTPNEFEQLCMAHPRFQLNLCNKDLKTALHRAVEEDNVPLIKYIVERAPQLLERGDGYESTALWIAATEGKLKAVETLLELGANPNITIRTIVNKTGKQVDTRILSIIILRRLHCSDPVTLLNISRIIKLLVKNGAKPSTEPEPYQEIQLRINSIFENVSKEVAKEQAEIVQTINNCTLLINDLSRLISEY